MENFLILMFTFLCVDGYSPPPNYYHTHEIMTAKFRQIVKSNPHLASMYSIGNSIKGRALWVIELTASRNKIGVPYVKLIGNIHGNEPVGKELLIHLAKYLVDQYNAKDSEAVLLLQTTKLHILPSMNPDGFNLATEGICYFSDGRNNANNTDLNRNFPDVHFYEENKFLEPETKAVIKWLKEKHFVLSTSLHGGALVASYPLDDYNDKSLDYSRRESKSDDDDVFKHLALVWSKSNPVMYTGHGCMSSKEIEFKNGITNGAAWYPVTGGMQDLNYISYGCMEITLELSCCKYPLARELGKLWNENKLSMLNFIKEAQRGVKGLVLDGSTGRGIEGATVTIENRNSTFRTTHMGEFWRILLPGTYFLKVTAANYKNVIKKIVIPQDKSGSQLTPIWVNVTLARGMGRALTSFSSLTESFHVLTYLAITLLLQTHHQNTC